ncbi:MAG: BamA/TamA family outer membrane protein [Gemmatimonadota bacterium]|nr:MAG: BamA/TamA family outer membrane protein [Gemmatimonadota bacterium]
MKSRQTWERILSFPGNLFYFPIEMVFKGVERTTEYLDESKLVYKIFDKLTTDDGLRGVRPYYSSRAGGGIKLFQKNLLNENSKLTLTLAAGLRERRRYELRLKRVQFPGQNILSDYKIRYQFLSDESFYGIGKESQRSGRSNYAHEQIVITSSFEKHLNRIWSVNALIGFEENEIQRGRDIEYPSTTDLYADEKLSGLSTKNRMGKVQFTFEADARNHRGQPTAGYRLFFGSALYQQVDDKAFGFWKFSADFSKFVHLFYNRTIVLRVAGEVTEPFRTREIPFYHLAELGSRETIRGFRRGRFRDEDMILGSLEYRYPVWFHTDIALFVDAGHVTEDIFREITPRDVQVGYGIGIRLLGGEDIITKFEISNSREQLRVYFELNPDL